MNRRGFLRSLGALAAAAVAGPALAKLAPTEVERLIAAMRTGVVRNQTFYFTEPITIQVPNLIIDHCSFVFRFSKPPSQAAVTIDAHGLQITNCNFEFDGARTGIRLQPQAEHDMTSSVQSALDAAWGRVDVAPGNYQIKSAIRL
jgi:hypothetical protein